MSQKAEIIILKKELRRFRKAIKAHCIDCNYDLKHDCKVKKCALYPYVDKPYKKKDFERKYLNRIK